jgi:hypothetical protein
MNKFISFTFSKKAILLFIFYTTITCFGQSYLGGHFSTKDAMLSNTLNPAAGVAGEMKWQTNVLGFNAEVGNNYFSINGKLKGIVKNWDKDKYIGQNLDGKRKELHINVGIMGPGGFIRIKEKNAITFGSRVRAVGTFNDINQDFVYSMYNHFEDILQWLPNFNDERAAAGINVYSEFYAGFARSINLAARHSLHVGATVKMTSNIFNAQFTANNLDFKKIYSSAPDSFINVGNTKFDLNVSTVVDNGFDYKFGINGFGFDVGLIYEFKQKNSDEHFIMVGASVNDLGYNTYKYGKYSRSFVGNNKDVPAQHLVDAFGKTINIDAVLDSLGTRTTPTGKGKIKLPTTVNIFADIRVIKMFYINTNFQFNPYNFKKGTAKANMPTDITITPRFDSKIVSVFLPINYNQYSGFNTGIGARIGQFTIGSSSIITSFAKKKFTGIDFYVNIAIGKTSKTKKESNNTETKKLN